MERRWKGGGKEVKRRRKGGGKRRKGVGKEEVRRPKVVFFSKY